MTSVNNLWYLASEATQQAEQTYHRLGERHDDFVEFETTKHVSRYRFRTVATRIEDNGAPYGAHTLVYRDSGELLLVRHEGVDKWVLPGGEADDDESFREAAVRELREEAGIEADYEGLGMLVRVTLVGNSHSTRGVLPIFEARPDSTTLAVEDPDGEISDAQWFAELPEDTRDREQLKQWREQRFGE